MSVGERDAIWLRVLRLMDEGRSVSEVAGDLGLSEPAAQALIDEAVQVRESALAFWESARTTADLLWAERKAGRFESKTFMRPVLSHIGRNLREVGFRRKGSTFRREPEPGLLHTVEFQTGLAYPNEPTDTYGHFAVNLLVDLDEVRMLDPSPHGDQPRQALGPGSGTVARYRLGADWHDMWWPMVGETEAVADTVLRELDNSGLPFLARFPSRAAIEHELRTRPPGTFARPVPLLLAALHLGRRDRRAAHRILAEYLDERDDMNPGHRQWVERLLLQVAER